MLPKKDAAIDVSKLVELLEKEVGIEPITEVTLEMQGRLEKRGGKAIFEVSGNGQVFRLSGNKVKGPAPPHGDVITVVGTFKKPKSASDGIVLHDWKRAQSAAVK